MYSSKPIGSIYRDVLDFKISSNVIITHTKEVSHEDLIFQGVIGTNGNYRLERFQSVKSFIHITCFPPFQLLLNNVEQRYSIS